MPKTFYITTAIDYTNSPPHIGHTYEKVLADVIARYQRLKADETGQRQKVFFLTGADQHGQKVQQSAAKAGVSPAEFVKGITQQYVDLWKRLDVKYDDYAETISPLHKKVVQGILQRLKDKDQIYKDKQSGYYSVRQEQFLTDKERGPDGEFGPEWGQVEFREEENYYFKLSQHKEWLLGFIKAQTKREISERAILPNSRRTELENAVYKLSGDLCISRPKSRLDWGIELPFDHDYVNYVWFDALSNYISFAGYDPTISSFIAQPSSFLDKWPAVQIIGKDILVPAHGIYWLIMLRALGFPDEAMPQLLVHGWWNMSGAKMSKSVGNIVDPNTLADKYSVEAVRYYLMSDIATGSDADFSEERLVARYNADLANSLGNLLNRTLTMIAKYRPDKGIAFVDADERLKKHRHSLEQALVEYREAMGDSGLHSTGQPRINDALGYVRVIAASCDGLIEEKAPWKLARLPAETKQLETLLYCVAESLRVIAILIWPVLPKAAHGIFDQLKWKMDLSGKEERFALADAEWGKLPDGHVVGKPVPLFPRIEGRGD